MDSKTRLPWLLDPHAPPALALTPQSDPSSPVSFIARRPFFVASRSQLFLVLDFDPSLCRSSIAQACPRPMPVAEFERDPEN